MKDESENYERSERLVSYPRPAGVRPFLPWSFAAGIIYTAILGVVYTVSIYGTYAFFVFCFLLLREGGRRGGGKLETALDIIRDPKEYIHI